jgi:hypothetical protein
MVCREPRPSLADILDRNLSEPRISPVCESRLKVGLDRASRTLTRLRLDDVNFEAVRNAIAFNPKARCKPEEALPASYPWVQSAEFRGGFLDGVSLEFSPNLTCIIGGRGSGKSTALVAIRAALSADTPGDDPDEAGRMPDETVVRFIDAAGSEREVIRRRGEEAVDPQSGSPIRLRSGARARGRWLDSDDQPRWKFHETRFARGAAAKAR